MESSISNLLVPKDISIREAMAVIERAPHETRLSGIAVVVGDDCHLQGVVTDGDIRTAILQGISLEAPVSEIMTTDPIAVVNRSSPGETYAAAVDILRHGSRMLDRGAGKIVIVDQDGRVEDVVSFFDLWRQADVKSRSVTIVGMGYVGLTLAVALADVGFNVYGVDANPTLIASLQVGKPHFFEKALPAQFRHHLGRNLKVGTELDDQASTIYIIAVGTPVDPERRPVLRYVESATRLVGRVLKSGDVVILRSTVPVGTTRMVCLPLLEEVSGLRGGDGFSLVFAPERTAAGSAVKELRTLPQVIGSLDSQGMDTATSLFRELTSTLVSVDSLEAAEMVKLLNNSFRDFIFSFSNEVALVCDLWGIDGFKVIEAANEGYPRDRIPLPSPGVGGVCLTKDPHILIASALEKGYQPRLLGRSRMVNEAMPYHVFNKFWKFCQRTGRALDQARVLVVGFAFKGEPETSDMRDSVTLQLASYLREAGVIIRGYDPVVEDAALATIDGVAPCGLADGFSGVDAVIIMNNHRSYVDWDLYDLLRSTRKPMLFLDGWHLFHADDVCRVSGVSYSSLSIDWGWPPETGALGTTS